MRMRRKKESGAPDGAVCPVADFGPPGSAGQLALLAARSQGAPDRAGVRQGPLHLPDGRRRAEVLFVAVERVPDAMVMAMERARTWSCTMSLLTPTRPICRRFCPG